jgi:PIN domain nuclease of toxin-antitoxin system
MRVLLDTHVWLWMLTAPERLAEPAGAIVADTDNVLLLSAASAWEIAIKHGLGKLALPQPPGVYVPTRMASTGVLPLPVTHRHALQVVDLPAEHADPFDRLLIAQAQLEDLPILTADDTFERYDVELIAAT